MMSEEENLEGGRGSARLIRVSPAPSPVVVVNFEHDESSVVSDFEVIEGDCDGGGRGDGDVCLEPVETSHAVAQKPTKKLQFSNVGTCDNSELKTNEVVIQCNSYTLFGTA